MQKNFSTVSFFTKGGVKTVKNRPFAVLTTETSRQVAY